MASCTSVFTGPPLTAGVDAPAIEYLASGDQITAAVSRVNAVKYFKPICVGRPQIRYAPAPSRRCGIPRNSIYLEIEQKGVIEFAIDTGDK
jgi:hypothetical protein